MKEKKVFCGEWVKYETVAELLKNACEKYKALTVFAWKQKDAMCEVTYEKLEEDILFLAGNIMHLQGQHIAVVCDQTYECYLCIYSIMVAGKVVIPIEANLDQKDLEKRLLHSDASLLLYGKAQRNIFAKSCPVSPIESLMMDKGKALTCWPKWEKDRLACMVFSSGTGGEPSLVMLSQGNLAAVSGAKVVSTSFFPKSKTIMLLPMHHIFGIMCALCFADFGSQMCFIKSIKYLQKGMIDFQPDYLLIVPMIAEFFYSSISKKMGKKRKVFDLLLKISTVLRVFKIDLRRVFFRKILKNFGGQLKSILSGGAAISRPIVDFFDGIGIDFLEGYGMTESGGVISVNTTFANRKGSVGIPMPYNEIKISNNEILVKGVNLMSGYYKNSELTKIVFEGEWLKTGDLGYLDNDGFLYITGRKKNLIILSNGENVSPEVLEMQLLKNIYIREVVIREKDNHIHADIYPDMESGLMAEELKNEIEAFIQQGNRSTSLYKRIQSWEFREEPFEKTKTLKIKRN